MIAPTLACADWLNLEREIAIMDQAGGDFYRKGPAPFSAPAFPGPPGKLQGPEGILIQVDGGVSWENAGALVERGESRST